MRTLLKLTQLSLENRDFGVKGPASAVVYDNETTRLIETSLEDFEDE